MTKYHVAILGAVAILAGIAFVAIRKSPRADSEASCVCKVSLGPGSGADNHRPDVVHYLKAFLKEHRKRLEQDAFLSVVQNDAGQAIDLSLLRHALGLVRVKWQTEDAGRISFAVKVRSKSSVVAETAVDAYATSIKNAIDAENTKRRERVVEQAHMHTEKAKMLLRGLIYAQKKLKETMPQCADAIQHEVDAAKRECEKMQRIEDDVVQAAKRDDVCICKDSGCAISSVFR